MSIPEPSQPVPSSPLLESVLRFAVQQRFIVIMLVLGVAGYAIFSFQRLPIDAVPDITNNQLVVNTRVPGLSPIEMEKQVTFPVETALAGIPGLESTRSISRNGFCQVTAIFHENVDVYFARQQVNERLTAVREELPPGAEPMMGPITTGLGEVYKWTVEYKHPHGKGYPFKDGEPGWQSDESYLTPEGEQLSNDVELASYLRTVQAWIIAPQLKQIPNVAGIDSLGGYEKQYHVSPDPMKLVSYGLTLSDVIEALERNNVSSGAGYIEHNGESYLVRADDRIATIPEIRQVVIGTHDGIPIHVSDVASVGLGKELRGGSASENGEEVVIGTALMLIGANSRTVAGAVNAALPKINAALPPDIEARTILNRMKLVNATIETVRKNLFEGAVLVIVVLLLVLGNYRAAIICALAIPLSMLMAATGMVRAGISGNLMSLGAIDFGLIVDGTVIIVENCIRRLAEKQHELGRLLTLPERLNEVMQASKQMLQPTVYGQAIIITVYFPLLTLSGVEGKMFKPMAFTVIFALIAAFILSLTFVPAMVAILMGGKLQERENQVVLFVKRFYEPVLAASIRYRYAVLVIAVVTFLGALLLFKQLGQEFIPTLDEKDLLIDAMRIPSISLTQATEMQFDLERQLKAFPEVETVFSQTGTAEIAEDPMPINISDTFIILKPQKEWPNPSEHKEDFVKRVQASVLELPGNNYEFTQPIQMRFNELLSGVKSDVAVKIYGDDTALMLDTANKIAAVLANVKGSSDMAVDQVEGLPVLTVKANRPALSRYGLSVDDVQNTLDIAVGGREAGKVFEGDRRFDLIVRLPDSLREDLDALSTLPIPLPEGDRSAADLVNASLVGKSGGRGFIALGDVASLSLEDGPNEISRENGKRMITVQCNVRGRDIGSFVTEAQATIAKDVRIPAGNWIDWGGQFQNLSAARQRLMVVVPVCFLLIFMLLYSAFGSVSQALIVFTGVPLALSGGVLALWLRMMSFSITAAVGFIALSGVAVLNGLVMVSYINQLRREGVPLEQAITQGSLTRLRPVLMTALVASLGFIPMAISHGTGAEIQKPLATVVIGGLISSTLLTLVVLPAIYGIFQRDLPAGDSAMEPLRDN